MTLAEKIIDLRKKKGWSQEQLAEQLDISRQSVSKWESESSTPDLDKIIRMSEMFGVSTDYLLKDEIKEELPKEAFSTLSQENDTETVKGRSVSKDDAESYMSLARKMALKLGLGVMLCILSPVCLIILGGLWEYGYISISEDGAAGIGMIVLFAMIAIGVALLVYAGLSLEKYEFLEKEEICLQDGIGKIVSKYKEGFSQKHRLCIVIGVVLCILSVVPIMVGVALNANDLYFVCCVGVLLAFIAIAVFGFVWAGTIQGSYDKLLQEGDYTIEKKAVNKKTGSIAGVYWCIVTALFFIIGFNGNKWEIAGIIWPVAGVLFAAIIGIMHIIEEKK